MPSSEALVLRTIDFSESSLVVTLLTRQFGKIEALAKGGRRLKGPFESSLDVLARSAVTFIQKRGDVLDLLTESKLIRRFHVRSCNLAGTLGGYYAAELIMGLTAVYDPHPALYDVTVKALRQLESGTHVMRTLTRFEGRLLQILGYAPSLRTCAICGVDISGKSPIVFGVLDGGVLCSSCVPDRKQTIASSTEVFNTWEALTNPIDRREEWKHRQIRPETLKSVRQLANAYICVLFGTKPKMHDWWKMIEKYDRG